MGAGGGNRRDSCDAAVWHGSVSNRWHDISRARLPDPRPASHGRGTPRRRRLLVARREATRLSERARTGQSVLSDLYARSRQRRREADLAWAGQDDVRVLPSRAATRFCFRPRITIRNRSSIRTRNSRSAPPARSGATRGTTTPRWTSTPTARRAAGSRG